MTEQPDLPIAGEAIRDELMGERAEGDARTAALAVAAQEDAGPNGAGGESVETEESAPDPRDVRIAELEKANTGILENLRDARKLNRRFDDLEARLAANEQAPAVEDVVIPPDQEEDPVAYAAHAAKETGDKLDAFLEIQKKGDEAKTQAQSLKALQDWIGATETAYEAEHPEYESAEEHWTTVTTQNLKLNFPQASQKELDGAVLRAEMILAAQAKDQGKTLPEMKVAMATIAGWKVPEAETETEETHEAADESEVEDDPIPEATGKRTKRLKIAKSLEGIGGAGQSKGGKLSLKKRVALAAMKPDKTEYNAIMDGLVADLGTEAKAIRYIQASG